MHVSVSGPRGHLAPPDMVAPTTEGNLFIFLICVISHVKDSQDKPQIKMISFQSISLTY